MATTTATDSYDYDLKYSRLLAVLEHDGVAVLQASKILIIGAGGLGAETAKNLALMGVSQIYVQDDRTMQRSDLSSSILFKQEDVGKNIAKVLSTRLLELNEDAQIKIHSSNSYDGFDLVCVTEARSKDYINAINTTCRANRTPLIIGDTFGVFGFVFNDLGDQFVVSNSTDQDMYARYQDNHNANEGTKTVSFTPFSEFVSSNLDAQKLICADSAKANNFVPLLRSLINFREQHGRCPLPWGTDEAQAIVGQAKQFGSNLNENLLSTLAQVSSVDFSPVTSVIGGLMTHEIVKAVTRRGNPIEQILFYECSHVLPQVPPQHDSSAQAPSRYEGLEALFGRDSVQQIQQSKVLVAGAGSIGCEILKNLAALGVASENSDGEILVIDRGRVKVPHLCSQVLYRPADLLKNKADVAAERIKQLTSGTSNITACVKNLRDELSRDEYKSWAQHDVVFGTTPVRHSVDDACVFLEKPLIDCVMSGTRGHVQVIYPHLTTNVNLSNGPARLFPPSDRAFLWPYRFDHCLRWAQGRVCRLPFSELNSVKQYLDPATKYQLPQLMTTNYMYEIMAKLPRSFEECIKSAIRDFNALFYSELMRLLSNPVPEWLTPNQQLPKPFSFNVEDPLHVTYVTTLATLIAQAVGFEQRTPVTKQAIETVLREFDASTSGGIQASNVSEDELVKLADEVSAQLKITPIECDIDSNRDHLIVIHSGALLRARAFGIEVQPVLDTLMLLKQRVPKIITTSSIIAGLAIIEFIKMRTRNNVECTTFSNSSINTFVPSIVQSYPIAVPDKYFMHIKYTLWNKFVIDEGDLTFQELLNLFKHKYNLTVELIGASSMLLYGNYIPSHQTRLSQKVSEFYLCKANKTDCEVDYFLMDVVVDNDDIEVPKVVYRWSNLAEQCQMWK